MSSEQLAAFVGYDLAQVAKSLDLLDRVGVLRRSLNPTHVGRLYKFIDGDAVWLRALLHAASTPDGRRRLIGLLLSKGSRLPEQSPRPNTEAANHA